jgi:hypothetical protein
MDCWLPTHPALPEPGCPRQPLLHLNRTSSEPAQRIGQTFKRDHRASTVGASNCAPLPFIPPNPQIVTPQGTDATVCSAVPVQRDRRSMSRRPGQNGRLEKRGDSFSFLFYRDIPGTNKRQRVRRALKATTKVAAKQEAQRIIDGEGVNTAAHLDTSRGPVVTFGIAAELWKSQQLHANGKHSSKRTMGCELEKHVLPHLKDILLQEITYPVVRGLIQAWKKEELGNKSMRNLFGIVRAIYNFYLDETAQRGQTIMLPWQVKWLNLLPRWKSMHRALRQNRWR